MEAREITLAVKGKFWVTVTTEVTRETTLHHAVVTEDGRKKTNLFALEVGEINCCNLLFFMITKIFMIFLVSKAMLSKLIEMKSGIKIYKEYKYQFLVKQK